MSHDHHMGHSMDMDTTTTHNHMDMTTAHNHGDMTTAHDHGNMGTTDGMNHMDHMDMMKMYFHFGFEKTILFQEWSVDSVGAMVGSCIGIFFIAVLYEGLKYFREKLHQREYVAIDYSKVQAPEGSGHVQQTRTRVNCKTSLTSPSHFIQTGLHLIQLTISYILMLIVMTYNVWLCISVVLGCTVGYFLFGWSRAFTVDLTEHCH